MTSESQYCQVPGGRGQEGMALAGLWEAAIFSTSTDYRKDFPDAAETPSRTTGQNQRPQGKNVFQAPREAEEMGTVWAGSSRGHPGAISVHSHGQQTDDASNPISCGCLDPRDPYS